MCAPGGGIRQKFGPGEEPVFGPSFRCKVSHFAIRRQARDVRSIRFSLEINTYGQGMGNETLMMDCPFPSPKSLDKLMVEAI